MEGEGGMLMMKKAEIDTTPPFRSVKEAVLLFGDRVLASELYTNKLKEMHAAGRDNAQVLANLGNVTAELEETKESLQKAQEESMLMASCLSSLQEELERTKRELRSFKKHEFDHQKQAMVEPEIDEDIKFIEDSSEDSCELIKPETSCDEKVEFQKKRYVTFANQPSVSQVVMPQNDAAVLERHNSIKRSKKKIKSFIPLISGLFSRKKGGPQMA